MVEGQFVLKGVTRDDLKFYNVLRSLQETALVPGWVIICGFVASLVMEYLEQVS
jgi:hypothetical protein